MGNFSKPFLHLFLLGVLLSLASWGKGQGIACSMCFKGWEFSSGPCNCFYNRASAHLWAADSTFNGNCPNLQSGESSLWDQREGAGPVPVEYWIFLLLFLSELLFLFLMFPSIYPTTAWTLLSSMLCLFLGSRSTAKTQHQTQPLNNMPLESMPLFQTLNSYAPRPTGQLDLDDSQASSIESCFFDPGAQPDDALLLFLTNSVHTAGWARKLGSVILLPFSFTSSSSVCPVVSVHPSSDALLLSPVSNRCHFSPGGQ